MNLLQIIFISIKILFFLRNYEKSRKLVKLLSSCVDDIGIFLLFLVFWVLLFSLCQVILGSSYEPDEYQDLPRMYRIFIQTWRNSIGDYGTPVYEVWSSAYSKKDDKNEKFATLYISLIWILWVMNQLFIQVILLNFLIAIVNNSYQREMRIQNVMEYIHKSDVNSECSLFDKTMSELRSFVLCRDGDQTRFNFIVIFKAIHDSEEALNNDEDNSDLIIIENFISSLSQQLLRQTKQIEMNVQQKMDQQMLFLQEAVRDLRDQNRQELELLKT